MVLQICNFGIIMASKTPSFHLYIIIVLQFKTKSVGRPSIWGDVCVRVSTHSTQESNVQQKFEMLDSDNLKLSLTPSDHHLVTWNIYHFSRGIFYITGKDPVLICSWPAGTNFVPALPGVPQIKVPLLALRPTLARAAERSSGPAHHHTSEAFDLCFIKLHRQSVCSSLVLAVPWLWWPHPALIRNWSRVDPIKKEKKKNEKQSKASERPVVLSSKLKIDHDLHVLLLLWSSRSSAHHTRVGNRRTHTRRERRRSPSNGGCPRFHARVGPRASGVSPLHAPTARTHAEGKKESVSSAVHLSTVSTRNRAVFAVTFLLAS